MTSSKEVQAVSEQPCESEVSLLVERSLHPFEGGQRTPSSKVGAPHSGGDVLYKNQYVRYMDKWGEAAKVLDVAYVLK
jgi:hypothetical protein